MAPKHSSKNLDDIKLEDIDFETVKEASEKAVVKTYIKLLEEDGSYFHELLQCCKDKLLEVSPKDYYLLYPRVASASEVDDITRDLLDWQESVKETDAAISASRKKKIWDEPPGAGVKAPIRGQEEVGVVKRANLDRKEEIKDQDQKLTTKRDDYARDKTKMKDYYRKWEQVDVDQMEADMDQKEIEAEEARRKHFGDMREEQEGMHRSTPVKTSNLPEGVPEAHRRHMADSEKEKGNEAFYAKDFEEAEAYYSRSLHFRADDPSCWANRALSRLKLDNAAGGLEDCEHALAINPRYMKALHRKGKCLHELQRYEEAVKSFQLALMESPGNTQINGDLMIARRKLRSDGPAPPPPQPKTFAPPARSRGPREESTCVIEEVFDDEEDEEEAEAADAAAGQAAAVTASAAPAPGYTRVAIEEDSDSEEEEEKPSKVAFHKVQIEDASDDSEEGEPEREPAAVPRPAAATASGFHKVQIQEESDSEEEDVADVAGFHKVQIVDGSDTEDEEEECAQKASAPGPEVCTRDEAVSFDDMD